MYSLGDRATVPVPAPLPPAGVQSPLSSWTPLLLVVGYIAPFYMRPYASRNALSTVYFRATVTVMWCSVAWIPLFLHLAYHQVILLTLSHCVHLFQKKTKSQPGGGCLRNDCSFPQGMGMDSLLSCRCILCSGASSEPPQQWVSSPQTRTPHYNVCHQPDEDGAADGLRENRHECKSWIPAWMVWALVFWERQPKKLRAREITTAREPRNPAPHDMAG